MSIFKVLMMFVMMTIMVGAHPIVANSIEEPRVLEIHDEETIKDMIETAIQVPNERIETRLFAQATIKEKLYMTGELLTTARDAHFFRLDVITADFLRKFDKLPETLRAGDILTEMEQLFVIRALEIIEAKLVYELDSDRDSLLKELEERDISYNLLMNMAVRMLKMERLIQDNI